MRSRKLIQEFIWSQSWPGISRKLESFLPQSDSSSMPLLLGFVILLWRNIQGSNILTCRPYEPHFNLFTPFASEKSVVEPWGKMDKDLYFFDGLCDVCFWLRSAISCCFTKLMCCQMVAFSLPSFTAKFANSSWLLPLRQWFATIWQMLVLQTHDGKDDEINDVDLYDFKAFSILGIKWKPRKNY